MNTTTTENLDGLNLHDFMEKTNQNVAAPHSKWICSEIKSIYQPPFKPFLIDSISFNFVTNGIKYRSNDRLSFIKTYTTIEDQLYICTRR
jgi:hypothetical protein